MPTISSIQAGARLLAAAMRDPAPILNLTTFWDCMKVVEAAASHLTDDEKANPLYQDHVSCYDRVYQARTDMIPVSDGQMMQMGEQLIEALSAYAEQAADLLPVLLEHGNAAWEAALRQEFADVFSRVERDIEEVPGGPEVQQALAVFRQWTQREHADALYVQALDLYDKKQYVECLALLGQALPLEQDNAHLYYCRGNTRHAMKDFRGAAAEYLWALRCAPYYFSASMNLGNTYEALGWYEKSLAQFQHALVLEPESAAAHYNLGGAYYVLSRLPEALDALSKAIELEPAFAAAYLNRANTFSRAGRHEEALADYRQALALEPSDSNIAWTATWSQFGCKGLDDAQVGELERISRLDPEHYTSHCCLAVLALHRSERQASLLHLERAVTMEPEQWDPHFWIGLVAALTGETEVARQAIERSQELGLPPLLLTPLSWLKAEHADYFERYGRDLLQHCGVTILE